MSSSTAAMAAAEGPAQATTPEWVEIMEPRSGEHMFANLTTGECVWEPPPGVEVKKTNDNQWWELFDQNTARFYYYNATSQKTVWHRPTNCDIIPLAKLQTLKQNTEVREDQQQAGGSESKKPAEASVASQTSNGACKKSPSGKTSGRTNYAKPSSISKFALTQTSPVSSPKASRRRPQRPQHRRTPSDASGYAIPQQLGTRPLPRYLNSSEQLAGGADDKRRTTIGPSQAKYYSVPHHPRDQQGKGIPVLSGGGHQAPLSPNSLARQRSLEGESFRRVFQPQGVSHYDLPGSRTSSQPTSISRSVSFMSRGAGGGGGHAPQRGDTSSDVGAGSSSGRRSIESTPLSSRRLKTSPDGLAENNALCTPHNPRKAPNGGAAIPQAQPSPQQTSPPHPDRMSISDLVDTGLSTLTENAEPPQGSMSGRKGYRMKPAPGIGSLRRKASGGGGSSDNGSTLERPVISQYHPQKMSPLQQYILEQAKLSGYRFGDPLAEGADRDSYVESEDDWMDRESKIDDSDVDFADDEDGGCGDSDNVSKASSIDGEGSGGRYLSSEPTYNNLDPMWIQQQQHHHQQHHQQQQRVPPPHQAPPPVPPHAVPQSRPSDVDAFSEEFDLRMRFSGGPPPVPQHHRTSTGPPVQLPMSSGPGGSNTGNHTSTLPRPVSHGHAPVTTTSSFPVPYEVLHPSLQRNSHSLLDSSTSLRGRGGPHHPPPHAHGHHHPHHAQMQSSHHEVGGMLHNNVGGGSMLSVSTSIHSTLSCESDIERYAQDNLNLSKKGLFRKKVTVKDMLSHTKESLRKPLTCLQDKQMKKEAIELFRWVQIYMGDRRAKQGMTINSVALDITSRGFSSKPLRDELFLQLCKQTTENLSRESLRRGWELLALCLSFFPPSRDLRPALSSYIAKHRDPTLDYPDVGKWPIHVQISHYAGICAKRLDRMGGDTGRLEPRKPTTEEIDQSRLQIFRPSMFGGTLQEVMDMQRTRYPHRKLPWILTTLADQILALNGASTEGLFRVPADMEEVNSLKSRFDQWEVPACGDCHTAASLIKLWLRELYEPLVPDELYARCVAMAEDSSGGSEIDGQRLRAEVLSRMPPANRHVLLFLVRFLQLLARPEVSSKTKMDASNLGTVFAPNFLRCPSKDPSVILENTRKEMAFVKSLIFKLDTQEIEGVL